MKKKLSAIIAILLVFCLALPGCSSKQEKKLDDDEVISNTENKADSSESVADATVESADNSKELAEAGIVDEIIKAYPEKSTDSIFFPFVTEAPEEMFMQENTGLNGRPYLLGGKVTKIYDDATAVKTVCPELFEKTVIAELNSELMTAGIRGFMLETEYGPVIVVDMLKGWCDFAKDQYKDDIMGLKSLKTLYDGLNSYKEFPENGEKVNVYGLYMSYSESGYPIVVYGLSYLNMVEFFGFDYASFRSGETKHVRYKNYFEMDIPVSWSDEMTSGDYSYYYFTNGQIVCDYFDDNDESMTLEDFVPVLKQQFFGEDLSFVTILQEDIVSISEGAGQAYTVTFQYPVSEENIITLRLVLFKHKHKLCLIYYYDYNNDENSPLFNEDFDNVISSIKLSGF